MKISNNYSINTPCYGQKKPLVHNGSKTVSLTSANIMPSYKSVKAKFLPVSFGAFKKIGTVEITDRKTNKLVTVDLKSEDFGDYTMFKLFSKGQELGFIDIISSCSKNSSNNSESLAKNSTTIVHLRSYKGNEYSGIGTALMKAAINKAIKNNCADEISLYAETGYQYAFSPYRSNESPIPFYYKLGFEATDLKTDEKIRNLIARERYDLLPSMVFLKLSDEELKKYKNGL